MNVVHALPPLEQNNLVVLSATLREYVGLSRDGGYLHHIRPSRIEEPVVGDGKRMAGALTCDCRGGYVRGSCYWVKRAEAYETGEWFALVGEAPRPDWATPIAALEAGTAVFDAPFGAGDAVEAGRG